ncbi:MAG: hypothetical protein KI790_04000 [Cyclobacteriaceae bacterium]|nr:hypothetical protein [Cyclobacteriaceae bacterium HetDA_MAG_MS6]
MNKQKFIELIRNPSTLTSDQLQEIEDVVDDYPYFQSARTLLAKGSKVLKHKAAKKRVASAAIYATDRILLKKYINDHLFFLDSKKAKVKSIDLPDASDIAQVNPVAPPVKKTSETPPPSKSSETPKMPPPSREEDEQPEDLLPSSSQNIDALIEEVYKDMEELRKSKAKFMELERKIEEEDAVQSAIDKVASDQVKPEIAEPAKPPTASDSEEPEQHAQETEAKKEDTEEIKPEPKEKVDTKSVKPQTESDTKETKPTKKPVAKKATTTRKSSATTKATPAKGAKAKSVASKAQKPASKTSTSTKKPASTSKSTSATKKTTSKTATSSKKPSSSSAKKPAAKTTSAKKSTKSGEEDPKSASKVKRTSTTIKDKPQGKKAKGKDQEEIIDDFIKNRPNITPASRKTPTGKNEDLSAKSTRFHVDIASEYLAEIYISQGKYDRAIGIYENLGLKFPEKTSYFADLIDNLKKK